MGERKVMNKYYPPDFDPSKLPRVPRPRNQQIKVRMMLPMSIRCKTCGNYIYQGTKFNSRKEDATGQTYLGIQIFRFYFRCTHCSAEIILKTDPEYSDYVVESGATRNFEPWRAEEGEVERTKEKRKAEEMGDAMKSLENRSLGPKRQMDNAAALDELMSLKKRQAAVPIEAILKILQEQINPEKRRRRMVEEIACKETNNALTMKDARLDVHCKETNKALTKPNKTEDSWDYRTVGDGKLVNPSVPRIFFLKNR